MAFTRSLRIGAGQDHDVIAAALAVDGRGVTAAIRRHSRQCPRSIRRRSLRHRRDPTVGAVLVACPLPPDHPAFKGAVVGGRGRPKTVLGHRLGEKAQRKRGRHYGTRRAPRRSMMKLSACGRFVVLEGLHIDHRVLESLASWGTERGLPVQDAIQVAICAFNDGVCQPASEWRDRARSARQHRRRASLRRHV